MENNADRKDFIRQKVLSYKPDFDLEILQKGLDKFEVFECKEGDYILRAGEVCKKILMAEHSITRCYFIDFEGEERTIWLEKENTLITEYESFRSQTVSRCNIFCYEDSTFYAIDKNELMMLYAQYHDWAIFGLLIMEDHYVELLRFRNTIIFNSAAENYDFIESNYPRFLQVVPFKHLASWFNISAVHLSRIRKERANLI